MKLLLCLIIMCFVFVVSPYAYADCITNDDVKNCTARDLSKLDSSLNQRYSRLLKILPAEAQKSLKIAQKRWISSRDGICAFEREYLTPKSWYEEDAKGEMRLNCLTRLTKHRLVEINEYIELLSRTVKPEAFNDINDLIYFILTDKENKNNPEKISEIIDWINDLAVKVEHITGKKFTDHTKEHSAKYMFYPRKNILSSHKKIRTDKNGSIVALSKSFIIVLGDCNISFAKDSIIVCTGNIGISHSSNNIVISSSSVGISHDGSVGIGSLVYCKESIKVSHSNSSVFVSARKIHTSNARNSECINIIDRKNSHSSCEYINDNSI